MYRLIRASAGSGKTFQLSNHFLHQLFLGNSPETILATTFTRKAAGEILGRVLMRLADAADDPQAAQQLREFLDCPQVTQDRAAELLGQVAAQLHRMRVCTLDSFFQQVARSLTLELGLPPGWSIIDDHTDQDLRQQAIDAVLSQQIPREAQRLMQMLAKGRSKRSVRDLIDDTVSNFYELFLLTESDAWQRLPKQPRLTRDQIQQTIRDLYACDVPAHKTAFAARAADVERFQQANWEAFLTTGLAKKVFLGDFSYQRKPLSEGLIETYETLIGHAKAEILDTIAQQTRATYDLIVRFDREYTRLRNEHGWMRFNDVTRTLARSQSAADGHRMSFRLDSSIRHLLLDEFQDTSPDQWTVLKRLAMSITGQPDGQGSFFCVGDPKQAIYSWRGGVAEILDAVERTIPDIAALSLDVSRRSSAPVIETVNRVFQHISQHSNLDDYEHPCRQWSTAFPDHSTAMTDRPGFAQLRSSPRFAGQSAEERRVPYYRWIAQQIQELHRQAPGAEIGVLTRKNATVARLVHELTLLGVPASEEGGTPPTDSPAALAVFSLLHLASHPGCQVSRFHVATSPLADVVGLHSWTDDAAAAELAVALRARLLDDGYGLTLQWLSEAVRPDCSQRDVLRLKQIVAEGWQFDQTASLNPAEFVRKLQDSRLSKSEAAAVRVMTVHQSKGLEFDIVVLPELEGSLFQTPAVAVGGPGGDMPPDSICLWRKRELRSLLPEALQQAFEQTIAQDVRESLCLLYVALTRAVHALHLFVPPLEKDKLPKTYGGLLLASLADGATPGEDEVLFETGDEFWMNTVPAVQQPRRLTGRDQQFPGLPKVQLAKMPGGRRRGLRRATPSQHAAERLYFPASIRATPDAAAPANAAATAVLDAPTAGSTAVAAALIDPRQKGTLIHAWFEAITWLDQDPQPDVAALRKIAAQLAVPDPIVDQLLPDFQQLLQHTSVGAALSQSAAWQTAPFAAWAQSAGKQTLSLQVHNERPFVFRHQQAIVQGTIDRLVLLQQNGQPVAAQILDFKTDRLYGETDVWQADRVSHYGPQLETYRAAVSHCFRIPRDQIITQLILLEVPAVVST